MWIEIRLREYCWGVEKRRSSFKSFNQSYCVSFKIMVILVSQSNWIVNNLDSDISNTKQSFLRTLKQSRLYQSYHSLSVFYPFHLFNCIYKIGNKETNPVSVVKKKKSKSIFGYYWNDQWMTVRSVEQRNKQRET